MSNILDLESAFDQEMEEAREGGARPAPGKRTLTQALPARSAAAVDAGPSAAAAPARAQPVAGGEDPFSLHLTATVAAPAPEAVLASAASRDTGASVGEVEVFGGGATRAALDDLGVRGAATSGRAFVADDDPAVLAHEVAHARGADEAGADRAAAGLPWMPAASAPAQGTMAAQFWGGHVRGDRVNLRPTPTTERGDFPQLTRGTVLTVADDAHLENGFWHVSLEDGRTGYVSADFVEGAPAAAVAPVAPVAPTGGTGTGTGTGAGAGTGATTDGTTPAVAPAVAPAIDNAATDAALTPAMRRAARAHSAGGGMDQAPVSHTFLGHSLMGHPVLNDRLSRAEAHLAAQHSLTGRALGDRLGILGRYRHHRPGDGYHHFALAIDINYESNPWIGGQHNAGDRQALALIWRAVWLTGIGEVVSPSDSWARRGESTGAIWDHFDGADRAVHAYLGATDEQVAAWITAGNLARTVAPPGGARPPTAAALGEARLRPADAAAWRVQINADRAERNTEASNWGMTGAGRARTDVGIMNLDRTLVVALREVAGLGWGATDFGDDSNGDMMHFDCRFDYAQPAVAEAVRAWRAANPP